MLLGQQAILSFNEETFSLASSIAALQLAQAAFRSGSASTTILHRQPQVYARPRTGTDNTYCCLY